MNLTDLFYGSLKFQPEIDILPLFYENFSQKAPQNEDADKDVTSAKDTKSKKDKSPKKEKKLIEKQSIYSLCI